MSKEQLINLGTLTEWTPRNSEAPAVNASAERLRFIGAARLLAHKHKKARLYCDRDGGSFFIVFDKTGPITVSTTRAGSGDAILNCKAFIAANQISKGSYHAEIMRVRGDGGNEFDAIKFRSATSAQTVQPQRQTATTQRKAATSKPAKTGKAFGGAVTRSTGMRDKVRALFGGKSPQWTVEALCKALTDAKVTHTKQAVYVFLSTWDAVERVDVGTYKLKATQPTKAPIVAKAPKAKPAKKPTPEPTALPAAAPPPTKVPATDQMAALRAAKSYMHVSGFQTLAKIIAHLRDKKMLVPPNLDELLKNSPDVMHLGDSTYKLKPREE